MSSQPKIRKSQASLSTDEKKRLVDALLKVKANGKYDEYVKLHLNMGQMHRSGPKRGQRRKPTPHMKAMAEMSMAGMGPMIHGSPIFLPWHRELLRRLELDLQAIDSSVTLPYWDWTVDRTTSSPLWHPDFMGGDGRAGDGRVMDGPFAYDSGDWTLRYNERPEPDLKRELGASASTLPSAADASACLRETPYDESPWSESSDPSFRNRLEGWRHPPAGESVGMHNLVHVWVGGTMDYMSSPNDPVFFLHHANVDRIWARWQHAHPQLDYAPPSGGRAGDNRNDPLEPWGAPTTVESVLDHHALGYSYDDEGAW
jgi:tyrosinase